MEFIASRASVNQQATRRKLMSALGQKRKYSQRADVVRFAPKATKKRTCRMVAGANSDIFKSASGLPAAFVID